jgi:hypothetical protein
MSHTPTPWQIEERDCGGYKLADADGEFLSYLCQSRYPDDRKDDEAEANAAFIVKACNAHDELVAALTAAADWIEEFALPAMGDDSEGGNALLADMRRLLD